MSPRQGAFTMISACAVRNACLGVCLLSAFGLAARAQSQAQAPPFSTTLGQSHIGAPSSPFPGMTTLNARDPGTARLLRKMARERNQIRQKEIVTDTDRLLALARRLNAAVNETPGREGTAATSANAGASSGQNHPGKTNRAKSSPPAARSSIATLAEIEKLARIIGDKMLNGQ